MLRYKIIPKFHFFNLVDKKNNFKFMEGPSLIQARAYHCSAVMTIHGEEYIVVAGGDSSSSSSQYSVHLDSVEILNPIRCGDGWKKGEFNHN